VAAGFSRRVEIEEPAGTQPVTQWLARLIEEGRLELPFEPQDLAPKLRVRNRRTSLHLIHPNGAEIELALDRVTFEGPRGEASELEIEGELLAGDEGALYELRDWLLTQPGLTPSHAGKYVRALLAVG
jgi:inorganic triphosphatase YgiF